MNENFFNKFFLWVFAFCCFFIVAGLLSFCFGAHAEAKTFPNNAISITYNATSGTSGTLLAATSSPRTILYCNIMCPAGATGCYINIGATRTTTNTLCVNGGWYGAQNFISTSTEQLIRWEKPSSSDNCVYTIVYTDYNYQTKEDINNFTYTMSTSTIIAATTSLPWSLEYEQLWFGLGLASILGIIFLILKK